MRRAWSSGWRRGTTCPRRRMSSTHRRAVCSCSGACAASRRTASNGCRSSSPGKWARTLPRRPARRRCALPGFLNRKHSPAPVVTVEYRAASAVYGPGDFPAPAEPAGPSPRAARPAQSRVRWRRRHRRARQAVSGGDSAGRGRPAWRRPDVPRLLSAGARIRARNGRGVARHRRLERALRSALVRAGVDREVGPRAALWAGAHWRSSWSETMSSHSP